MSTVFETIDYKGYTIRVVPDMDAENPWESWDTEPPLVACHLDHGRDSIRSYGVDLTMPGLPREVILRNYKTMLMHMGYADTWRGLLHFARREWTTSTHLHEAVEAAYEEHVNDESISDRVDTLAEAYGWLGVPALSTCAVGFSQGDYADLLIVATNEWRELVGVPDDMKAESLESSCDLYRDWAFGSVYGYQAVDADGEDVSSCYGYFGFDHEASGLLEAARDAIDGEIAERAEQAALEAPYRERALNQYGTYDVQIYPDSGVDIVDDGAWVQARIWIPN